MSADRSQTPQPPPSRIELYWLGAAILIGIILRFSFPNRMAVEHFDEGVYASNFWFGPENDYSYPARHLYAPPLLPAAIEWTMILASLFGVRPDGWIPMIPCLLAGLATIPSIWWIGRQWFGPTAGLVSAWLAATSDFHVSYSRAALTDVPVCLFILWAVYFAERSFAWCARPLINTAIGKSKPPAGSARYPWRIILLAGGFTGLAWWTKYHGWLPLAIAGAGGFLWQMLTPPVERQFRRVFTCWILIAAIAAIVWSPVVWGLQKYGGYTSVAANHRNYIVGLKGWGDSAWKQARHVGQYDNLFGMFTEPFAVSDVEYALTFRYQRVLDSLNRIDSTNWRTEMAFLARKMAWYTNYVATFAVPVLLLVICFLALAWRFRRLSVRSVSAPTCLLCAWLIGMSIATPAYYPYPRLVFPLLTAIWLGIGLAVQTWRIRPAPFTDTIPLTQTKPWSPGRVEWILVIWLVANSTVRSVDGTAHAWKDRSSLAETSVAFSKRIAEDCAKSGQATDSVIIYVWGEPAMVFGMHANGFANTFPVPNLKIIEKPQPGPAYLIYGKQSFTSPDFPKQSRLLHNAKLVEFLRIEPSHLVQMDSPEPLISRTNVWNLHEESTVWLYRLRR